MAPFTQDASASTYQIMSYLLLDSELATRTNLLKSTSNPKIHDIYDNIKLELDEYMKAELYPHLAERISSNLTPN